MGPRLCSGIVISAILFTSAQAGAAELASRAGWACGAADAATYGSLSADGRYIAFVSSFAHLIAGQQGDDAQVFLRDRIAGTTTLVSHKPGLPTTGGSEPSGAPVLRYVSDADDLVSGQVAGPSQQVFLYDRLTGSNTLVSHTAGLAATPSDGSTYGPRLSADGRYVAFESTANNLIPGQVPWSGYWKVFRFDRTTGQTILASHASGSPLQPGVGTGTNRLLSGAGGSETTTGQGPNHGPAYVDGITISRDGRSVFFVSSAIDLVPGDYNETYDVFVDHTPGPATDFYTAEPCRLLDTRTPEDGPALVSGAQEILAVHGACGIPPTARALVVNVTVIGATGQGNLRLHPGGLSAPETSTINFAAGQTRANNAIVPLTPGVERGLAITPFVVGGVGGSVHVLVDVSGWFE